ADGGGRKGERDQDREAEDEAAREKRGRGLRGHVLGILGGSPFPVNTGTASGRAASHAEGCTMGNCAPEPTPRSWGTALFAGLYFATLAGALMKIVPKFSEVYRQVKVPMPGPTELLMTLSDLA